MKTLAVALCVALALVLLGAAFLLRQNRLTAEKLCQVLYIRIAASDRTLGTPKSSSYDYFHAHPKALIAAHRETADVLASLPCRVP